MAVQKKKAKKEDVEIKEDVFESTQEEATEEVEKPVEEDGKSKEPSVPMSTVEKWMKDMEEKLTNTFNSRLNKLKASSQLDESAAYVKDLEDDWLESPVIFFAYSSNFSIHGDKKKGIYSESPTGPVKFKTVIRTKRKGRKETQVISVSSVKVHSKALVAWLRGHSQFGIAFFENMDSAMNVDTNWAQKLVEANQSIQSLSDQQVIARSRQEGLPITTDPDRMRRTLVEHIAKKSIKKQDYLLYGKLRESELDAHNRVVLEK
jgi:hypothetical protein